MIISWKDKPLLLLLLMLIPTFWTAGCHSKHHAIIGTDFAEIRDSVRWSGYYFIEQELTTVPYLLEEEDCYENRDVIISEDEIVLKLKRGMKVRTYFQVPLYKQIVANCDSGEVYLRAWQNEGGGTRIECYDTITATIFS